MTNKKAAPVTSVDELVGKWTASSEANQHLGAVRDLLRYLSHKLYDQYKPIGSKAPTWERLSRWLANVSATRDKQTLLELVPWLLYVGTDEMDSMYRAAFEGPIARWIIEDAKLDITSPDLSNQLTTEVKRTFFGSIAGMQIDSFIRINGIAGQSLRPDFRQFNRLGAITKLRKELRQGKYKRIVAVEDVVGTGEQMEEAAELLVKVAPKPVLLCPLLVAPDGVNRWHTEIKTMGKNLHFDPLVVIPPNAMIPKDRSPNTEPTELQRFRQLLTRTWGKVEGTHPDNQLYSEYGFGNLGSLVLTFLNCPDNAPPLIHYDSDQWRSLFPRNPREG